MKLDEFFDGLKKQYEVNVKDLEKEDDSTIYPLLLFAVEEDAKWINILTEIKSHPEMWKALEDELNYRKAEPHEIILGEYWHNWINDNCEQLVN